MFRTLAIAGALLGLASVAQADVWRWTDPNGTIHYSDSWVPGSTLVKTESRGGYSPSGPAAASTPDTKTPSASDQAQAQRDQRTVQADVAKAREESCKKAKDAYDKAIASRRIYTKEGPHGERDYMSDAEADAFRMRMMNARKQACGS
jgi:hypothetical protein